MSESASAPAVRTTDALGGAQAVRLAKGGWSRHVAADVLAINDALLVLGSGFVPGLVFQRAGLEIAWGTVAQAGALAAVLAVLLLKTRNFYDASLIHDLPLKTSETLLAAILGVLGVAGFGQPDNISPLETGVWHALWLALVATALWGHHVVAKLLLRRWTALGRFDERVIVFGAGRIARHVHDHLAGGVRGIHFVGVFDDRSETGRVNAEGLNIAGTLADLLRLARTSRVDRIIIALPAGAEKRIADVIRQLAPLDATVHVVSHVVSEVVGRTGAIGTSHIGPVGLIDVRSRPLADWSAVAKRIEDLVIGSLLLVVSLPLLLLIAVAVKLDSAGPVLFRQRRRGLNKHVFEMLKFRTMSVLEDGDDVRQAERADPRVTRVGRWLRATSLDELPQLVNVIRGDMSLVGPRPHALVHDDMFAEAVKQYPVRSQVKPGITGLAQVRGLRGETRTADSIEARVEQDVAYIRGWSVGLDLKILVWTIWAVLRGVNAH